MTLRMSMFASHVGGLSSLLYRLNRIDRARRRFRRVALALVAVALSGCVQSLNDLGVASHDIPPKLLGSMRAKGMKPESPVLVRIFKMESELEIWKVDGSGRYALLKIYPMCRWSGKLGPKTKTGDRQAPEGFYRVSMAGLNPKSQFYLSFNLGYPNRLEAALGYSGEALMVHGACSSSGCFALTDQGVGEIYAVVEKALKGGQLAFQVQAYPFRMTPQNLAAHRDDPNVAFWRNLKEGYDIFDLRRREPRVAACGSKYVFDAEFKDGDPADPLAACPVRIDRSDPAVVAKASADDQKYLELAAESFTPLAYQDGGMHPSFRALLEENGDVQLAEKVSVIKYPISRPVAALADPFDGSK
ncbi:murein L,D-transpeptidase [Rhizobium laguerreae]|uniref:L,D-transpeptidase family protein n=2 Tax=Rhizobium laguerreae TaxID=1076926 RepID=UPI001C8FDA7B|nr:murein L,D-transpeptidase family protein [Rhizobium laguerreae]MBY3199321.1 murein L,D-transpeptidase [Rhizobium laguerreae]MBY3232529.1 murein L,D-transpeptidase [Rhizobium laguerreae]MBY3348580.1 murein L,D-transpeptidase [Rhizobium laguerreae]MBY3355541.1 murein L,D-transpeptidase [Rhizobium laguerreae]MBY3369699.1 murein L,D-transpeptidase [Rhizobium laguerreae]